jgi:hypothetical protein
MSPMSPGSPEEVAQELAVQEVAVAPEIGQRVASASPHDQQEQQQLDASRSAQPPPPCGAPLPSWTTVSSRLKLPLLSPVAFFEASSPTS